MKKNMRIFGIGTALLLLSITITPVVLADQEWDDFCDETETLFETYEDDFEDLDDYISEYGPIDENFSFTQELEEAFRVILEDYEEVVSSVVQSGGQTKWDEYFLRFEWWFSHIHFKMIWWVATTFQFIPLTAALIEVIYYLWGDPIWSGHAIQLAQIFHTFEGNQRMRIDNIWNDYNSDPLGIIIDTGKFFSWYIIFYLGWTWQ